MSSHRRAFAAALLALVVGACSLGTPAKPVAKRSPSPSPIAEPSPSPSPSPTTALPDYIACSGAKHYAAAMVLVGNQLWESTDPTAPVLLCTFSGAHQLHFATATDVAFVLDSNQGQVVRINLASGMLTNLPLATAPKSVASFAYSADGLNIAYWILNQTANSYQGFLKAGAADPKKLTDDTAVPGRGVVPGDNVNVTWSPSGGYVAVVNTYFNAPHLQIFRPDGSSAFPGLGEEVRGQVMAAWGPNGDLLYFSDTKNLRTWAPPDSLANVGGPDFYDPTICQGGCALAYTIRDPSTGTPKVHVQSITSGDSESNLRSAGAFAAAGHLWDYAEEVNPLGGPAPPYRRNGKIYDYNVQTKLETQLPLSVTLSDTVSVPLITDVWPRS